MLKNYLTIALRNLRRHRAFSFINIAGLAVGMACCLLIGLYVRQEVSYDRFHENADRLYRVAFVMDDGGQVWPTARTPHPLAPALLDAFPEVEAAVRFRRGEAVLRRGDDLFKEEAFYFADASVFDAFSFPLIHGEAGAALAAPFTLVLTEDAARKYFGPENPVGRMLTVEDMGDFTVTGVLQTIPQNAHFRFDFLASYATLNTLQPEALGQWDSAVTSTYLLLSAGYDAAAFEAKLPAIVAQRLGPEAGGSRFYLTPLTDVHLYSDLPGELGEGGDARYLYLFSSVALFILLIACINFMSLTTARSAERAREVGLRKVLGAVRRQLVRQFLGESVLLALLAMGLAVVLVELTLPAFNTLTGKALTFGGGFLWWIGLLGTGLAVGVLAGSYPAFALSIFCPAQVLKSQATPGSAGAWLRKGLVVLQFGIAVVLITGTLVMAEQLAYIQRKNLGFDKEQVAVIPLQDSGVRSQYETIKQEVLAHPGVVQAAASYHTPGRGLGRYYVEVEGIEETLDLPTYIVDYDYLETMGMHVTAGRAFSENLPTDATQAFMVNETAVRTFGWDEPLGKTITWDSEKLGAVVGVVQDFHVRSLHEAIEPMILHIDPTYFRRLSVRIRPDQIPETLAFLKTTFEQIDPRHPFEYSFVDQDFAMQYEAEQRTARLIRYAAILAILIACLGLLGLAAFSVQRRTKEIGVRKVLGATIPGIVLLLSKDFVRLVLVALVMAAPLSYLAMNHWLADFAYRVEISVGTFVLAGGLALLIAVLTVSYQAIRAALADPVKSLRYE